MKTVGMKSACLCGHNDCEKDSIELDMMMIVKVHVRGVTFERKIPLECFLKEDLFEGNDQKEFDGESGSISIHLDAQNNRIFIDPKSSFENQVGVIGVSVDSKQFLEELSRLLSTIK